MVYSILNFPLPTHSGSVDGSKLLVTFELELEMIAVNRVGLLDGVEVNILQKRKSIYPL